MIDARGCACPLPVVMVQKAIKNEGLNALEVLVDNRCAVENISRYAASQNFKVQVTEQEDDEFLLKLAK